MKILFLAWIVMPTLLSGAASAASIPIQNSSFETMLRALFRKSAIQLGPIFGSAKTRSPAGPRAEWLDSGSPAVAAAILRHPAASFSGSPTQAVPSGRTSPSPYPIPPTISMSTCSIAPITPWPASSSCSWMALWSPPQPVPIQDRVFGRFGRHPTGQREPMPAKLLPSCSLPTKTRAILTVCAPTTPQFRSPPPPPWLA